MWGHAPTASKTGLIECMFDWKIMPLDAISYSPAACQCAVAKLKEFACIVHTLLSLSCLFNNDVILAASS